MEVDEDRIRHNFEQESCWLKSEIRSSRLENFEMSSVNAPRKIDYASKIKSESI